jgi:3-dehydroquinate dehydratase-2
MEPSKMLANPLLVNLRQGRRCWVVNMIDGPNMRHLGKRDPRLFGKIASIEALQELVVNFGSQLGIDVRPFVSDFEGDILEHIHLSASTADAYLVDAGGLTTVSEAMRHALKETQKPVVEVSFYNLVANGEVSLFTPSAIGNSTGFREYSYLAGLLGLVLSLDDKTFLHPDATESSTARPGGVPYTHKGL